MPRNAVAIALKIYFLLILGPMAFGLFEMPQLLKETHVIYRYATFAFAISGCLVSLIGIFWPRAHAKKDQRKRALAVLDGSVIEQSGLVLLVFGMIMFAIPILPALPEMGAFTVFCCGGFVVAFSTQWWIIRNWRADLRRKAKDGPAIS